MIKISWLMNFFFSDQSRTRQRGVQGHEQIEVSIATSSSLERDWIGFQLSCTMEYQIASSPAIILWVNNNSLDRLKISSTLSSHFSVQDFSKKITFSITFRVWPIIVDFTYANNPHDSNLRLTFWGWKWEQNDFRSATRSSAMKISQKCFSVFKYHSNSHWRLEMTWIFVPDQQKLLRSSQLWFFFVFSYHNYSIVIIISSSHFTTHTIVVTSLTKFHSRLNRISNHYFHYFTNIQYTLHTGWKWNRKKAKRKVSISEKIFTHSQRVQHATVQFECSSENKIVDIVLILEAKNRQQLRHMNVREQCKAEKKKIGQNHNKTNNFTLYDRKYLPSSDDGAELNDGWRAENSTTTHTKKK